MCGIYKKIIDKIKAGDPTWKDDFTENLNCLNPTQISAIEILSSTPATAELVDIIPTDCEGVATGEETKASATVVLNNVLSTLCNVDELADAIGDRMAEETQKIVDAITETSQNESELLTEISGKLDELEAIKNELVDVNTTLVDIKTEVEGIHTDTTAIKDKTTEIATNTAATNVKLEDIKTKLDTQIGQLTDLKTLVETSNTKLDVIETTLEVISTDIAAIKTDISAIKTDIADIEVLLGDIKVILEGIATDVSDILVAVQSIDTKLDTVITSLESIEDKLDTVILELQGIKSVLDAIKAELNVSLVYSSSELICADNGGVKTQAYVRTRSLWDNEAGISVSDTAQFSLDGSTWTSTAPAGTITVGACVADTIPDETLVDFQPVDCAGAPVGASVKVNQVTVKNKVLSELCNVDDITGPISDKLDEVIAAINDTSDAEQALLTAIDTKLEDLALIKAELVTANATLSSIKTDTAAISTNTSDILTQATATNVKLEDIKTKLDSQTTLLGDLKTELITANTSLATANATLSTISGNIIDIKVDIAAIKVDVAAIKTSVAAIEADTEDIKVAVQSIDTKLTSVTSSLTAIETKLDTINTTLQTEFDQTQVALGEIEDAVKATQVSFQPVDCAGANVGAAQTVHQTTVLNKVLANLCNTADIVDPIVEAIQEQGASLKKQDFVSWVAAVGNTLTIPLSKFSTISMLATKGEFTVKNTANDFIPDLTASAGALSDFVEISEDGIGTATGSTLTPQGYDTRANSLDMAPSLNSFLVTCVRAGVLKLELYRD